MQIWVIITTCIIPNRYEERKEEYIAGISKIVEKFKDPKYKIVIVENNSKTNKLSFRNHKTFLDIFRIPVLYTRTNLLVSKTRNYGILEMLDIFECIKHFNIQDDDFIVKVTGRYVLDDDCPFFDVIDNLENKPYSAVVRFGQFDEPTSKVKTNNCTTGIIGLKCKYVKQIELPDFKDDVTSIEMKWAKIINTINDSEICFLEKLGIFIKPLVIAEQNYYYII